MRRNDVVKIAPIEDMMGSDSFANLMMGAMRDDIGEEVQFLDCVAQVRIVGVSNGIEFFGIKGLDLLFPMDFLAKENLSQEEQKIGKFQIGDFVYVKEDATPEDLKAPPEAIDNHREAIENFKDFVCTAANQIGAFDREQNTVRLHPIDMWIDADAIYKANDINERLQVVNIKLNQEIKIKDLADEVMQRYDGKVNKYMREHLGKKDTISGAYPKVGDDGTADYTDVMVELENAPGFWVIQALEL